jgi:PIN domain nuclease of toxin-antitoxin system
LGDPRLSSPAAEVISEPGNHYSIVTVWEAAIKSSLGKLDLMRGAEKIAAGAFFQWIALELELTAVPVTIADVAAVEYLPWHHNDPFDRLLVSQAIARDLELVSSDAIFERYGVKRVW